ncbi:hypothetical protein [Haloechinothrix salitolerans]|uniref:DUF2306 domain-containing protein n=1 Tax=Haloechinothrix salitolerans TaxID=926830 RepID=A0ABW2C4L9_9PSEU
MLRIALVSLHSLAGLGGLLAGLIAMRPRPGKAGAARVVYLVCLGGLLASVVLLIAVDWPELAVGARVAFTGLAVLAAVMVFRMVRALAVATESPPGWQDRYVDHVYFTYVSLWAGFVVVPALNLPYPRIGVPLAVVAVLAIGHVLISRYKRRLSPRPRRVPRAERRVRRP